MYISVFCGMVVSSKKGHQKGHQTMLTNNQVAGLKAKPAPYTLSDKPPDIHPGTLMLRVRALQEDKTGKGSKTWIYTYSIKDPATGKRQKKRIVLKTTLKQLII